MYTIIISGKAGPVWDDNESIVDESIVDGVDCQDNFADYFDDKTFESIKDGYMSFDMQDDLMVVVTYESSRELNKEELTLLKKYTSGQLSDGIGEGFEQFPCMEHDDVDIYVSPWYYEQELTVEQFKDE